MGRGSKSKGEEALAKGKRGPAKGSLAVQDLNKLGESSSEEDEQQLDAFQDKRSKVSLDVSNDEDEDDQEEEEGIMNLEGSEDASEESDEDEDEDEADLDDEEWMERAIAKGGRRGAMAAQAKALGQKLKMQQGEKDSDEEQEEEEGRKKKGAAAEQEQQEQADRDWGANKRAYYADAESEEATDEEAAAAEEAEVRRLQQQRAKRTTAADYGFDEDEQQQEEESSSEEDDEDEEGSSGEGEQEDTMEQAAKKAASKKGDKGKAQTEEQHEQQQQQHQQRQEAGESSMQVERVERDLGALSEAERAAALEADAPELLALLGDMEAGLGEIRHKLGPLLEEVKSGRLATKEGLSYLEVKHLMMLQYCAHIVFYVLLKAEGRPVRDHPVMQRLVEIRTCLEKIRPIDKQMSYQVDKLVRATQAAQQAEATEPGAQLQGAMDGGLAGRGGADVNEDEEDMLAFKPNPAKLLTKTGGQAQPGPSQAGGALGDYEEDAEEREGGLGAGKTGVYRPPKLNPVSMDGKETKRMERNERRQLTEAGRRASRSEVVRALAAEVADAPEEETNTLPGMDNAKAIRMRQKMEMRAAEEEEMMTRVPLSKDQFKALKSTRRQGLSTSGFADDFADEVADLVDAAGGAEGKGGRPGLADLFARQKVSQRFGGEAPRPQLHGGDEDLPRRAPLHERRAQYDATVARKNARAASVSGDDEDMHEAGMGGKRKGQPVEDDEFYTAAKESAVSRKKARADKYTAPALPPPKPDEEVAPGQPRKITDEIQRNRGLTPHRRKDLKNPRKKHRVKYADAVVRRKGAVQEAVPGAAGGYGGEATGIKSKVTKGRKLG